MYVCILFLWIYDKLYFCEEKKTVDKTTQCSLLWSSLRRLWSWRTNCLVTAEAEASIGGIRIGLLGVTLGVLGFYLAYSGCSFLINNRNIKILRGFPNSIILCHQSHLFFWPCFGSKASLSSLCLALNLSLNLPDFERKTLVFVWRIIACSHKILFLQRIFQKHITSRLFLLRR